MTKPARPTLTAPVTVLDVIAPVDAWYTTWGRNPLDLVEPTEDLGRCFLCHQPIAWRVVVQDGTGAHHVLGQDCAGRLGGRAMAGLVTLARQRSEDRSRAQAERQAALEPLANLLGFRRKDLEAFPHPMAGKRGFKGLTLADYGDWWATNPAAKPADLRRALALCQIALGIETAGQAELREHRAAALQADQAKATELAIEIEGLVGLVESPELAGKADVFRDLLVSAVAKLAQVPSAHRPPRSRDAMEAAGRALHTGQVVQ